MRTLTVASFGLLALFAVACAKKPVENAQSSADDTSPDSQEANDTSAPASGGSTTPAKAPAATDANPVVTTSPAAGPAASATPTPATPATPPTPAPTTTTTPPPVTPPVVTPQSCSNGGVHEVEDNATAATATDLGSSTAFCGSISAATDADNFSFTLPADAKSFSWSASFTAGGASVSFTANGVTTTAGQAPPWAPGSVYVVTVTGAQALDYGITLNIGH